MNVLLKNIYLSRDFRLFRSSSIRKRVYLNVWLTSSDKSVAQISEVSSRCLLAIFSGRRVGVPWRYTNMAAPYWAQISAKYISRKIFQVWENVQT